MKKLILLPFFIIALFTISCKSTNSSTIKMDTPDFDRDEVWQLVSINQKAVRYAEDQEKITLQLNPESKNISGNAGCNNYFGQYKYAEPQISFSHVGCTQMLCPDAIMSLEEQYLPLLNKVTKCEITAYTLTLYQGDKILLQYEKK